MKALFEMQRTLYAMVKITTALGALRFTQENFHFHPIYFSITIIFIFYLVDLKYNGY